MIHNQVIPEVHQYGVSSCALHQYDPNSSATNKLHYHYQLCIFWLQHYGQYVPLVHALNYGNYHGDTLVRFLYYYNIRASFCTLLKLVHHIIANYEVITMFSTDNPE